MQRCPDRRDRQNNFARCCIGHYVRSKDIAVVRSSRTLADGSVWHGAYYSGIIHCNNWLCPVCGRYLARTRCDEIRRAGVSWVRSGGVLAMLTLTISHNAGDTLASLKGILDRAMQGLRRNNSVGRILKAAGLVGRIRSYEVQYGQINGYHPHCHNLYFLARPLTADEVAILKRAWVSAVSSSGGEASWEIGLDYMDVSANIGDYLTKVQSISAEMSLGNLTKDDGARSGHYSPMQLLGLAARGSSWAADAYREEVLSMRGVHWVNWSKGLKARFGIGEISDEEARAQGEGEDEKRNTQIAVMSGRDYKASSWRSRGRVLDVVAEGQFENSSALMSAGVRSVPGGDGEFPRLELVQGGLLPDDWDMSDVPDDDMPEVPDMPEVSCRVAERPTADLPLAPNCVGRRYPPTTPDLPYDSDILPYPLSPLGNIGIIPRDTGQSREHVL